MEELLNILKEYAKPDYVPEMDSYLQYLLDDALEEVCNEMYPHEYTDEEQQKRMQDRALQRYRGNILKIAKYYLDKRGREGAISWSESGSSVTYESSGTPSSYLKGIIPIARIV